MKAEGHHAQHFITQMKPCPAFCKIQDFIWREFIWKWENCGVSSSKLSITELQIHRQEDTIKKKKKKVQIISFIDSILLFRSYEWPAWVWLITIVWYIHTGISLILSYFLKQFYSATLSEVRSAHNCQNFNMRTNFRSLTSMKGGRSNTVHHIYYLTTICIIGPEAALYKKGRRLNLSKRTQEHFWWMSSVIQRRKATLKLKRVSSYRKIVSRRDSFTTWAKD